MPASALTTQPATWPEGVIARYLTVGGATVDITYGPRGPLRAACTGEKCPWEKRIGTAIKYDDDDATRAAKIAEVLPDVQPGAQAHAETCRAMPRPTS